MAMSTAADRIRLRADAITWRIVDDEVIALDRRTWAYITINESGALLWPCLLDGASRKELVARLVDAYGIAPETASEDVAGFLGLLESRDLLAEPP
jgi:coenzyme PQQ synthesis protein D (PqqD)